LQQGAAKSEHTVACSCAVGEEFRALPVQSDGKTLTVVMAEPQNFRFVEGLGIKTGLKIDPRLGLRGEITQAIDRLYSELEPNIDLPSSGDDSPGIKFISSPSQERNVQAIREMQTELQQKSKGTPAVHLAGSIVRRAAVS